MKYLILLLLVVSLTASLKAENPVKIKTVHVYVALCDNENQRIAKVPARLGNGKDPRNNLYWGAAYGVKSYFKKSKDWKLVKTVKNPKQNILERIVFKNQSSETYLLADAYDGAKIKQTVMDFLNASAGGNIETISTDTIKNKIKFGGAANLIVYIGHNGLMDFFLSESPNQKNSKHRDIIILACYSKLFFNYSIKKTGANPLIWTSGLMAPEAYTLEAALKGWLSGESSEQIRLRAVRAYNHYQKCGLKGAKKLLLTGW
jgi:hypothetical protein